MSFSLALLLAMAQPDDDPLVTAWAGCVGREASMRLDLPNPGPSEQIADEALVRCRTEEQRLRQDFIREFGQRAGAEAFETLRQGARERLILRVNQGRALRGR